MGDGILGSGSYDRQKVYQNPPKIPPWAWLQNTVFLKNLLKKNCTFTITIHTNL